ncbi:hypothetical protein RND81_11G147300 [Saponaria officinalis]|uniref:Integrase catalytic domain-containing protein n=1 Tax=Saponaria officinalis TaxID=3572 RepID=A0AAW1HL90_SAPOF
MVRCWILNSMSDELKEGFMTVKTAKQLWSEIREMYGRSNGPLLFQLKKELKNVIQENMSIAEYFNKLKKYWDDIEKIESYPDCSCGALSSCSSNLLKKNLEQALKEKKPGGNYWRKNLKRPKMDERWCDYCKKAGHVREKCFRLHLELRIRFDNSRNMNARSSAHLVEFDNSRNMNARSSAHLVENIDIPESEHPLEVSYTPVNAVVNQHTSSVDHALVNALYKQMYDTDKCVIQDPAKDTVAIGPRQGGLYKLVHSNSKAKSLFDLIHVDLYEPYKVPSLIGAHYSLTIVDDNSRTTWTYLLMDKMQAPPPIISIFAQIQNQYGKSVPDNPQQNGRVERKHRHLVETARAIMLHVNLPKKFWGDYLLAATRIINKLPSPVLDWKYPFEILHEKLANYDDLKVIGCLCYALMQTVHKDGLNGKARRCVLLGYLFGQKAYRIYDLTTHQVFISRDVVFHEDILPFSSNFSTTANKRAPFLFPPSTAVDADDIAACPKGVNAP